MSSASAPQPDVPMVIRSLARTLYAVPTTYVREMLSTPEVRPVPQSPAAVRGLIMLRNTTLPLVDLRTVFGLPTQQSEAEVTSAREGVLTAIPATVATAVHRSIGDVLSI